MEKKNTYIQLRVDKEEKKQWLLQAIRKGFDNLSEYVRWLIRGDSDE